MSNKRGGKTILLISIWLLFFTVDPYAYGSDNLTADFIIKESVKKRRVNHVEKLNLITYDSLTSKILNRITIKHYSKTRCSNGDHMRLLIFVSPASIKGVKILALERANNNEIWQYDPIKKKSRRLTESEKNSRIMNSEFTYSDIFTPITTNYNHSILKMAKYNGVDCYVIKSVPAGYNVNRETVTGKILTWVSMGDLIVLKTVQYDMKNQCLRATRRINFIECDAVSHRWLPLRTVIVNERTKIKTSLELQHISFNNQIPDSWFAVEELGKE